MQTVYLLVSVSETGPGVVGVFPTLDLATQAREALHRTPGYVVQDWPVVDSLDEWKRAMRIKP